MRRFSIILIQALVVALRLDVYISIFLTIKYWDKMYVLFCYCVEIYFVAFKLVF